MPIRLVILPGDALVTDVKAGKTFFRGSKAAEKTGTMPTKAIVAVAETYEEGYHAGNVGGLSAIDADLAVGNIKDAVNIFGKVGTYEGPARTTTKILDVSDINTISIPAAWRDEESEVIPAAAVAVIIAMNGKRSLAIHGAEFSYLRSIYNGVERIAEFVADDNTHGDVYKWGGDSVGSAANAIVQARRASAENNSLQYTAVIWYVS